MFQGRLLHFIFALNLLNAAVAFFPSKFRNSVARNFGTTIKMAAEDPFSSLEANILKKRQEKAQAAVTTTTTSKSEKKSTTTTSSKPTQLKVTPTVQRKTSDAVPLSKQFKEVAPTVTKQIKEVVPTPPGSLPSTDFFAGIGLGLFPFILIPALLISQVKNFIKTPKSLITTEKKTKVQPFTKPLGVGAKEGISELLSDKKTPDLELDRQYIKLSLGGFALAAASVGALFLFTEVGDSGKSVPPTPAPVTKTEPVVKPALVPAPAPVVKPAPVPVPAPAPVVTPVPAPAPVVKPAPVPVPAPAPVVTPVPAPAPVVKPAPEPVSAPAPVVTPVPAPAPVVKPAPVPIPAPVVKPAPIVKPTADEEVVEVYKPDTTLPQAEKVDLEAIRAMRKKK